MASSIKSLLNAVVAIFQKSGLNMNRLSIVAKDYGAKEDVVGYYTISDRMKVWGKTGAVWGALWGLLFSSAVFAIPGSGAQFAAKPLVAGIVRALEGAAMLGGLSALVAGLYNIRFRKTNAASLIRGADRGRIGTGSGVL